MEFSRPENSPGVGSGSLLQGIFPTQGSNPSLLHFRQILYQLTQHGSPRILEWVAYPFSRGISRPGNWTGFAALTADSLPAELSGKHLVTKWCSTLCDSMDCSPPGSSAHGIFQARILEWVAISFFRGSSQPRNQTCIRWTSRSILYHWATWEALKRGYNLLNLIRSTGPVTIILPLTLHMVVNVSFSDYSPRQMTVLTQKRPSGTKKLKAVK